MLIGPSLHCKISPPSDISMAVWFFSFPSAAFAASNETLSIGPDAETP